MVVKIGVGTRTSRATFARIYSTTGSDDRFPAFFLSFFPSFFLPGFRPLPSPMTFLAASDKNQLSKTIRKLRDRLVADLQNAADGAYRLSQRLEAVHGMPEAQFCKRKRLEAWIQEQEATVSGGKARKKVGQGEKLTDSRHFQGAVKLAGATLLNRLVVLLHLEAQGIRRTKVVMGGWDSRGYREFREFAPGLCQDETEGYGLLLGLIYDELSLELPGVFGRVGVTELIPVPASTLREVVTALNDLNPDIWRDDTTLGWVYQYWNDPEREALDDKLNGGGKIESHEVASKTQMFTERYMVEWLLQNSLGNFWLELCEAQGWRPEAIVSGTLARLEERRQDWRSQRERGEIPLDALMPIETELEERWKYWVPRHPLTPSPNKGEGKPEGNISSNRTPLARPGRGAGGEGKSIRDFKLLDPACGSGHFLVIAFDLLWALYEEEAQHRGEQWTDLEIAQWIITRNLHGVDLDERAVQIAAAALYLKVKARVKQPLTLNSLNLVAANLNLGSLPADHTALEKLRQEVERTIGIPPGLTNRIVEALKGADAWGSLLRVEDELDLAIAEFETALQEPKQLPLLPLLDSDLTGVGSVESVSAAQPTQPNSATSKDPQHRKAKLQQQLEQFLQRCTRSDDLGLRLQGEQLAAGVRFLRLLQRESYDLVVGNPPYQGSSKMADASFLTNHYKRGKADLYAAFLERGLELAKPQGYSALLTMRNWMFISQYSAIRQYLLEKFSLRLLGDLDRGGFESILDEVVSTVMSVFQKTTPLDKSIAIQPTPLDDNSRDSQRTNRKRAAVLLQVGRYEFEVERFDVIQEKPIVYWWDQDFLDRYANTPKLSSINSVKVGTSTANNVRFTRYAWEIKTVSIYRVDYFDNEDNMTWKWQPFINGAKGRKWIEPLLEIINWEYGALECRNLSGATMRNLSFNRKAGVAFVMIGSNFSARSHRYKSILGNKGSSVFSKSTEEIPNLLAILNSSKSKQIMQSLNPGVGFEVGDVTRLPLFPIESADEIFAQLETSFSQHEAARETSVEFQCPGPSCWVYAQDWAQQAVDREPGEPLPPWEPVYQEATPADWVSYSVGVALGRFPANSPSPEGNQMGLPHGILYLSAYFHPESSECLNHPATQFLRDTWQTQGERLAKGNRLGDWLRLNFFKEDHLKRYEQRPIYFPLSSEKRNFVAYVSIHRWQDDTLTTLLVEYLRPDLAHLEGALADLQTARYEGDKKTQAQAEKRYADLQKLRDELASFTNLVQHCAETGPPPAKASDPPITPATYRMDLDDGVMINSAALWPLLEPQWNTPKTWWHELCTAKGKKDYDWSHLAARYFPQRVDQKCQSDPSLAVAHGCFWNYHPAKAYEWELRLQDEIGPDFTIDEVNSDQHRQTFLKERSDLAAKLREKEEKRRERKYKKDTEDLSLWPQ